MNKKNTSLLVILLVVLYMAYRAELRENDRTEQFNRSQSIDEHLESCYHVARGWGWLFIEACAITLCIVVLNTCVSRRGRQSIAYLVVVMMILFSMFVVFNNCTNYHRVRPYVEKSLYLLNDGTAHRLGA